MNTKGRAYNVYYSGIRIVGIGIVHKRLNDRSSEDLENEDRDH